MAKFYKIQVDDGKGEQTKLVQVEQGAGDKGKPVRLLAQKGARYELQQDRKDDASLAPDQVRVQRKGKNLQLWFDGSKQADVVIEGYYDDVSAMPTLVGKAENGGAYEYVPQDPAVNSMPAQLKDGDTLVAVSLGGAQLPGDFVLSALPLAAAAGGGISGWAIAGGAVAAGAAAGGGGGGGDGAAAAPKVAPSGQTAALTQDATNDTGVSQTDGVTKNNAPELTVKAESGAAVVVTVAGKAYTATETSTPGVYKVKLDALPDGVYTPSVKVTNSAGSSTVDGTAFTVDTSGNTNQPNNVVDPNADSSVSIAVVAITEDTGTNSTDFATADTTLQINGTISAFSNVDAAAGDRLLVQILNSSNEVVHEQAVVPTNGDWSTSTPSSVLPVGEYTIKAVVVDVAGNEVKSASRALTIEASSLSTVADTAATQEDATTALEGNLIQGTGANRTGADSATHVGYAGLHIGQVKAGAGSFENLDGSEKTFNGMYGALTVKADGTYSYTLSNGNANLQALAAGQVAEDKFTYTLTDGEGLSSESTLTIAVTGKNDVATFWQDSTQLEAAVSRSVAASGTGKITDVLTVKDADAGESGLLTVGAGPMVFNEAWQVGKFSIVKSSTAGGFNWEYDKTAAWTNTDAIRHDLFTVKSLDGKSSQTFDFEVTPTTSGLTKQEFHTQSTDGIKVVGDAALSDALVLHGAGSFDLSLANVSLSSVDRVDLRDSEGQLVKLNLANLTSADTTMVGSTEVHRLFVDGTSTDSVVFVGTPLSASQNSAHFVAGYTVYQINSTHDLLVSTAITNGLTFSNS